METDAIIVGSGMGGLTAASLLARSGQRVQVFESHAMAGGYATTFRRKHRSLVFDVSLHGIGGLAEGGMVRKNLELCGVWDKLAFVSPPSQYRAIFPEHDLRVPQMDLPEYIERLAAYFPGERAGLRGLVAEMRMAYAQFQEAQAGHFKDFYRRPQDFDLLMKHSQSTQEGLLCAHLRDPRCRALFAGKWFYHGVPPSRLPAMTFISAWVEYMLGGTHYPVGNCQNLVEAFVEVIRENGGEVRTKAPVKRIVIEGGRARGVVLGNGEFHAARTVICNADPYQTVFELTGPEHFPDIFLRRLKRMKPSLSSFVVYLGLDKSPRETHNLQDYETVITPTYDLDALYDNCASGRIEDSEISIVSHSLLAQPAADAGPAQINLTSLCGIQSWQGLSEAEYAARKARITENFIARLDGFLPGIRARIVAQEASTPLTNVRYTKNHAGSIYGFEKDITQSGKARTMSRSPVEGLFFSSAWTFPGGGYSGAIWAGYFCVYENNLIPKAQLA